MSVKGLSENANANENEGTFTNSTSYTDNFTARSFVSHSPSIDPDELEQIDMLPRINQNTHRYDDRLCLSQRLSWYTIDMFPPTTD